LNSGIGVKSLKQNMNMKQSRKTAFKEFGDFGKKWVGKACR
jgi:hypothetical protein